MRKGEDSMNRTKGVDWSGAWANPRGGSDARSSTKGRRGRRRIAAGRDPDEDWSVPNDVEQLHFSVFIGARENKIAINIKFDTL